MPRWNSDQSKPSASAQVAAVDHRVGLLGGARHAADRHAAFQDAGLGARHQRQHFGIVDLAALVDGGGEIAGADHGDVDAGRRHDLVDAVDRLDMLDGDHADHVVVGGRHVVGHRHAPAERRVERSPQPVAARRIAHAAHGLLGVGAVADHRKIDAERAEIHRRLGKPRLVGGDPHHRHAGRARGRRDHGMRRAEIDRAVLEIDDDPVERLRHDLHGLDARDGGDRAEGGAALAPHLLEAVERRRRCRCQCKKLRREPAARKASRSRRNAAAEKRHQRLAQRMRPSDVKIISAPAPSKTSPGVPSRSTTRRAIAGAGSIQSTGQGASLRQPVQQQRIMRAGQHHGVGARRSHPRHRRRSRARFRRRYRRR